MKTATAVKTFKALDKDFSCRGHKFKVGKTYTHEGPVEVCSSGFHGCENPLDVLNYYDLTECRFAACTQAGAIARHKEDSKIASSVITIDAELSLAEFVQEAVRFVRAAREKSSGRQGVLASSGNSARLASSGNSARLASSGCFARLASSGRLGVIAAASQHATAKGARGTWISLAEYDAAGNCTGFATGCVGKNGLKPDVFYRASGGKLVPF